MTKAEEKKLLDQVEQLQKEKIEYAAEVEQLGDKLNRLTDQLKEKTKNLASQESLTDEIKAELEKLQDEGARKDQVIQDLNSRLTDAEVQGKSSNPVVTVNKQKYEVISGVRISRELAAELGVDVKLSSSDIKGKVAEKLVEMKSGALKLIED